jgi:A/G-specific adenine glycosylase
MDLGATLCTPRNPDCLRCPLAEDCLARLLGLQEQRPVLSNKRTQPHYIVTAAVIHKQGRVLIAQRPVHGLLGGLWEFPGGKLQPGEDLASCLQREILEELGVQVFVGGWLGEYRHAYTHFRVTLHAFECTLANGSQPQPREHAALKWVAPTELADYPMGKIDRKIALQIIENNRILLKNRSIIVGDTK